ncbi:MAG: DNA-processing protein DprA, partial [Clostridia bacterium]|nr:DNA-processing protein DprA [Clostridia bacterium]
MDFQRDSYTAMLLTLPLSSNREEYAHPLSAREFFQLVATARAAGFAGVSALSGMDIVDLMTALSIPEEDALRLYILLNRSVTLNYALEGLLAKGIQVITCYSPEYPASLRQRLKDGAPPILYAAGRLECLAQPAVGVLGIRGVRTDADMRLGLD